MQKNVHVFCNKDIWKKKERNVWVKFVKIMCNGFCFCFFGKNVDRNVVLDERESFCLNLHYLLWSYKSLYSNKLSELHIDVYNVHMMNAIGQIYAWDIFFNKME